MEPLPVQLIDADGNCVPATLRDMDAAVDLKSWEQDWKPRLRGQEDEHWDWISKYLRGQRVNFEYRAIECRKATQGLMVIETDFHRDRRRRNCVYVDFLSVAPWNRSGVFRDRRYALVGSLLMYSAVRRSHELGYRYRTSLHSLPRSEGFYRKLGMHDFGPDNNGLRYFEFDETRGREFVER